MSRIVLPGNRSSMAALSLRQPWAWLIVNGFKTVDTRDWPTKFRGDLLIHAGKKLTVADYDAAMLFIEAFVNPDLVNAVPDLAELATGGVVGMATVVDCVQQHDSPWMTGNDDPTAYGFVMQGGKALPFIPWRGRQGFFDVVVRS